MTHRAVFLPTPGKAVRIRSHSASDSSFRKARDGLSYSAVISANRFLMPRAFCTPSPAGAMMVSSSSVDAQASDSKLRYCLRIFRYVWRYFASSVWMLQMMKINSMSGFFLLKCAKSWNCSDRIFATHRMRSPMGTRIVPARCGRLLYFAKSNPLHLFSTLSEDTRRSQAWIPSRPVNSVYLIWAPSSENVMMLLYSRSLYVNCVTEIPRRVPGRK